jgi:regulator of RNase E activity RraA
VVVVPRAIAEDVLAEAERKAATESEIRVAVRGGMAPLEAYERYGTF